ncbi:MAG: hypothetical protein ACLTG0_09075 [Oscillibacter sp.]
MAGHAPEQAALRRCGGAVSAFRWAKLNDKAAINAAAGYLGSAVYPAVPPSVPHRRANEAYFSLDPAACTMGTGGGGHEALRDQVHRACGPWRQKKAAFPDLSNEALTAAYPGRCRA